MRYIEKYIVLIILLFITGCTSSNEKIHNDGNETYKNDVKELSVQINNLETLIDEYKNTIDILKSKEKSEIAGYEEQIKLLEDELLLANQSLVVTQQIPEEKLKSTISEYEEQIKLLEDELLIANQSLIATQQIPEEINIELLKYKSLANKYEEILLGDYSLTDPINSVIAVNNIRIDMDFDDVINHMGEDYCKETVFNEYKGVSENIWDYEGLEIRFDPVFVNHIIIKSASLETNIGINVGDSAIESLEYCRDTFQVAVTPNGGKIFNWFDTGDGNYLILCFDKDLRNIEQNEDMTKETKIELIEISKKSDFD